MADNNDRGCPPAGKAPSRSSRHPKPTANGHPHPGAVEMDGSPYVEAAPSGNSGHICSENETHPIHQVGGDA